jgi:endonuclease/exonuclease/phosphatase family metal-dependent hydrolase
LLKKIFTIFLFVSTLCVGAKDFTVASYNVENLFDLKKDGTEYTEYTPNTKLWNKTSYKNKLNNIVKVLSDLNADIVALQEIESKEALNDLLKKLPQYSFSSFNKKPTSAIGLALISKYPIQKSSIIDVDPYDKFSRNILKVTLLIEKKPLIIYVNHWRSKRAPESKRIVYALELKKDIEKLSYDEDYIIVGDLNSNYNEYQTFKFEKKLNDTHGITGINQILNTTIDYNFIKKATLFDHNQLVHYNLWLELKSKNRFSSIYKTQKNTPDNIIVSRSLFDSVNISYVNDSFSVFMPPYLMKKNYPYRWNSYKSQGFSDHLPVVAKFSTKQQQYNFTKVESLHTIDTLYQFEKIRDFKLEDMIVVYKNNKTVIVKHLDQKICQRAVMIYNAPIDLQIGGVYDFKVDEVDTYNGLKEITKLSQIKKLKTYKKYKSYYIDGTFIDLFDEKYQNNIIKNLSGIYKKGYLYYTKNNKLEKIKLYFKKDIKRPANGDRITINSGHLGVYKTKVQIVLHSVKDYTVN